MRSSSRRPALEGRHETPLRGRLVLALAIAFAVSACAPRTAPVTTPGAAGSRGVRALRTNLDRLFAASPLSHALVGVEARSLRTGEVLYELNADKLVMPASNMKILTLAAAAERLGWDHRFETKLVSSAPIANGVLAGDLIVVGGGDPSINARDDRATKVFDDWAAQLKAAGVQAITGRLIGDDRAFDREVLGAGWAWDYLQYGYAAPVGALQYNEDLVRLTIRPGAAPGDPASIDVAPDGSGLTIANHVATAAKDARPAIDLFRPPTRLTLEVTGTVPAGAEPTTQTASVDNPTLFFVRALRGALAARGIEVRGEAVEIDDADGSRLEAGRSRLAADGFRVLASSQSPPLAEIATTLMKVSQNLYAETLLKTLARGDGPATTEAGRAVVREILTAWGVNPDSYVQYDGSGLSRYNYVTADTIVTILRHLYDDPRHREAFMATLPIAGRDGSIASRLKGTRAEANARAKTGSIANVRALSGYVTTRDGEPLTFSIIANHFTAPAAEIDRAVDLAVETLANFTRK